MSNGALPDAVPELGGHLDGGLDQVTGLLHRGDIGRLLLVPVGHPGHTPGADLAPVAPQARPRADRHGNDVRQESGAQTARTPDRVDIAHVLEIHRALRERGAEVRVATHGGVHERLLANADIDNDLVGPRMSPQRSVAFVRSAMGQGPVNQSLYTDEELRAYALAEADYFRANGVTVAVTGFSLTALLSTRLAGARLVTEHAGSWVPPVFERGLLPTPSSLPRMPRVPEPAARWVTARALPRLRFYCAGFQPGRRPVGGRTGTEHAGAGAWRPHAGAGGPRGRGHPRW
ncbi:hypothetical protein ABT173_48090 [Streptomyces sp. NPDC001795]|uniref:hypothetical protein n=1 Tax=Streptomyces sp. NPDC001795 TaxID=3154525 RepID=UPI00332F6EDD